MQVLLLFLLLCEQKMGFLSRLVRKLGQIDSTTDGVLKMLRAVRGVLDSSPAGLHVVQNSADNQHSYIFLHV